MEGYAYIMTHPGLPCVLWEHAFDWGLMDGLKELIALRRRSGITRLSDVTILTAENDLCAFPLQDPKLCCRSHRCAAMCLRCACNHWASWWWRPFLPFAWSNCTATKWLEPGFSDSTRRLPLALTQEKLITFGIWYSAEQTESGCAGT